MGKAAHLTFHDPDGNRFPLSVDEDGTWSTDDQYPCLDMHKTGTWRTVAEETQIDVGSGTIDCDKFTLDADKSGRDLGAIFPDMRTGEAHIDFVTE
ncbi:hypothetical protein [Frateuria sp. Soil773]|uniref:hypothetical protein n=1 Tax=Frateuria sp. Soil773 TaxID=1736407 RepID=UPI0012FBD495|nr:hypothetical protein [Frateuria sp. Soil773]